jgi:hypothetical protein
LGSEDRHIDAALGTEGGCVLCRHTKPALFLRVVSEIWPEDRSGLRPVRGTGSAYFLYGLAERQDFSAVVLYAGGQLF